MIRIAAAPLASGDAHPALFAERADAILHGVAVERVDAERIHREDQLAGMLGEERGQLVYEAGVVARIVVSPRARTWTTPVCARMVVG